MLRSHFFDEERTEDGVMFDVDQRKHQLLIWPALFGAVIWVAITWGSGGSIEQEPVRLAAAFFGWVAFVFWLPFAVSLGIAWLLRKGRSAFVIEADRIRLLEPQSGNYPDEIPRGQSVSISWDGCTPIFVNSSAPVMMGGGFGTTLMNGVAGFHHGQVQMAGLAATAMQMNDAKLYLTAGGETYVLAKHLTLPEAAALGRRVIAALSE